MLRPLVSSDTAALVKKSWLTVQTTANTWCEFWLFRPLTNTHTHLLHRWLACTFHWPPTLLLLLYLQQQEQLPPSRAALMTGWEKTGKGAVIPATAWKISLS